MKQTIQIGLLTATNIGIAFIFQWYVLVTLGPGIETDALFAGMTIPQLFLAVVSGSLLHVLVPILAGGEESRLRHDTWSLLWLVGCLFGFLTVVLFILAPWWVPLTVPGFSEATKVLTIDLTRIQLVGMIFAAVNGVLWATYHARQQFVWAEFTSLLSGVIALALLVWTLPRFGIIAAVWIGIMRVMLQTFLLAPVLGKPVCPSLQSIAILQAWQRIKPMLVASTYYKTGPLVDRFLLSSANSGDLSIYYLAQQIYNAFGQVINKSISDPLVQVLSVLYKSGDESSFKKLYYRKLWQVAAIGFTVLLILWISGQVLIDLLVGYGNVTVGNVDTLWMIMLWLSGTLVGVIMTQVVTSAFYAIGNTKTVMYMAIFTYTLYIPIKIIFFSKWGVSGLAISTSAYLITNTVLIIYLFKKVDFEEIYV